MMKLFCTFMVLIGCAWVSASNIDNLFRLELLKLDSERHFNRLKNHVERKGDDTAESMVAVYGGDTYGHWRSTISVLNEFNPYFERGSFLKIQPGHHMFARTADWLKSRMVTNQIPWSCVYIENGQELTPSELDELVSKYFEKKQCIDPEHGLFVENCGKLVIIISTNFGSNGIDDNGERQSTLPTMQLMERDLRRRWENPKLLSKLRRIAYPFEVILEKQDHIDRVVEEQREKRRGKKAQNDDSCEREVDVDFLVQSSFVGQTQVLKQVQSALRKIDSGMKTSKGPVVFLFAGPAGLGKTLLAKLIARAYHCGEASLGKLERESKFLQVDMVNYQDERAVDGFVDPSPGLQGTGLMSKTFSEQSRVVVLLDEIEKAHPSLLRYMLLPMLDSNDGHIQIKKTGETIPTKDAIFILTTNCFGDEVNHLHRQLVERRNRKLDEETYEKLVTRISSLMRNASMTCHDAHSQNRNPFASEPLWRRLVAGHSLANSHGMFLFLPPSREEIDALVEHSLEAFNDGLVDKEVFYSDNVLAWFQRKMNLHFQMGNHNMGTIGPFVENTIINVLPNQFEVVYLYLDRHDNLVAHSLSNHVLLEADEDYEEDFKRQDQMQEESSKQQQEPTREEKGLACGDDEVQDFEYEVEIEIQKEEQMDQDEMFHFSIEMALSIALFLVGLHFLWPVVTTLVAVAALVLSILYWVSPDTFYWLLKLIWYLLPFLYKHGKKISIFAIVFMLASWVYRSFWKRKAKDVMESHITSLELKLTELEMENKSLKQQLDELNNQKILAKTEVARKQTEEAQVVLNQPEEAQVVLNQPEKAQVVLDQTKLKKHKSF